MASNMIDTKAGVVALIDKIESAPEKPIIFVDIEGVNLSRHGSIAIVQILVPPSPTVHLLDVHTLQKEAFETAGSRGQTLRDIFQSDEYPKVFFDVRRDSDALFAHFQVKLQSVIDLQLLEYASRQRRAGYLAGLSKCIAQHADLDFSESIEFQKVKDAGCRLFAPEKGGSYEVFLERPLSQAIVSYCVQDVKLLPKLLTVYASRLPRSIAVSVHVQTLDRVKVSQSASFTPNGRHMAVPPFLGLAHGSASLSLPSPMSLVLSAKLPELCALSANDPPETILDEPKGLENDSLAPDQGLINRSFLQRLQQISID